MLVGSCRENAGSGGAVRLPLKMSQVIQHLPCQWPELTCCPQGARTGGGGRCQQEAYRGYFKVQALSFSSLIARVNLGITPLLRSYDLSNSQLRIYLRNWSNVGAKRESLFFLMKS